MKTLHLILKQKWYDMFLSGAKNEEYRNLTNYWISRFCKNGHEANRFPPKHVCTYGFNCNLCTHSDKVPTDITHVCFHRAYTSQILTKEVDHIEVGVGQPQLGAPEYPVFIIKFK